MTANARAALGFALTCIAALAFAGGNAGAQPQTPASAFEPPDPMRTSIPIGAPDYWPWTPANTFVGDERTVTQLVVYVDGRMCGGVAPQFTATNSLAPALLALNRAFYESIRTGAPVGDLARRHLVEVYGTDSIGRRSLFRFFAPPLASPTSAPLFSPTPVGQPTPYAINTCSDLRLPRL